MSTFQNLIVIILLGNLHLSEHRILEYINTQTYKKKIYMYDIWPSTNYIIIFAINIKKKLSSLISTKRKPALNENLIEIKMSHCVNCENYEKFTNSKGKQQTHKQSSTIAQLL